MPKEVKKKITKNNLIHLKGYNFDDRYIVNTNGDVILVKTNKKMKPFKTRDGYLEFVLTQKDGTKKHIQGQRVVALIFIPNPNNLPHVNHKKGIRTDNRVSELEWTSITDNLKHSYNKLGRKPWNKK